MCWDLGLGDELCHLVTNAPCQIPDIAVPLKNMKKIMGASSLTQGGVDALVARPRSRSHHPTLWLCTGI